MVRGMAEVDRPALASIRSVYMNDRVVYDLPHPEHAWFVQEA